MGLHGIEVYRSDGKLAGMRMIYSHKCLLVCVLNLKVNWMSSGCFNNWKFVLLRI